MHGCSFVLDILLLVDIVAIGILSSALHRGSGKGGLGHSVHGTNEPIGRIIIDRILIPIRADGQPFILTCRHPFVQLSLLFFPFSGNLLPLTQPSLLCFFILLLLFSPLLRKPCSSFLFSLSSFTSLTPSIIHCIHTIHLIAHFLTFIHSFILSHSLLAHRRVLSFSLASFILLVFLFFPTAAHSLLYSQLTLFFFSNGQRCLIQPLSSSSASHNTFLCFHPCQEQFPPSPTYSSLLYTHLNDYL